jgi:hypothetical protein
MTSTLVCQLRNVFLICYFQANLLEKCSLQIMLLKFVKITNSAPQIEEHVLDFNAGKQVS